MIGYIYKIINNINGKVYVGQTININRRKNAHYNQLKNKKHHNKVLQKDFLLYGEDNFSFYYKEYEISNRKELNDLEIKTIEIENSYWNGYNLTLGGEVFPVVNAKLSYKDFCFIYYGCLWRGYTQKIANYLKIDSSTVSAVLRGVSYVDYYIKSLELTQIEKENIQKSFRKIFNIPENKEPDSRRVPNHLTEKEYFYCFCISSSYSRGIDKVLSLYFKKDKSFLYNGLKNKSGKVKTAWDNFKKLNKKEIIEIGIKKYNEWKLKEYSKKELPQSFNDKWLRY